jgi:hypothetical protein
MQVIRTTTNLKEEVAAVLRAVGDLRPGQDIRTNCPICGGKNTFTATVSGQHLIWNCYKASCPVRGVAQISMSAQDIKETFQKKEPDKEERPPSPFQIPQGWTVPSANQQAGAYIIKHSLGGAINQSRASLAYDPVQHRLCFLLYNRGLCFDAVGRTLHESPAATTTKWHRYGNSPFGYVVHKNIKFNEIGNDITDTLVIVEDATSAVRSSMLVDTMALLGTSLTDTHMVQMQPYHKIIVALDPDARAKNLEMIKRISMLKPCVCLSLKDDLKYGTDELKRILH